MDWVQVFVLAIIQGLTEFLPVSSSGHLVLVPAVFGWPDQGLAFDVAMHIGTLIAVLLYFHRDLTAMVAGSLHGIGRRQLTPGLYMALALAVATVPVGLVGLTFGDWIEANLRSPLFVAGTLTVFGVLMWLADRAGSKRRDESSLKIVEALLIGGAQALALMPGTSRSGVTMTAGLMLGLTREAAARFSFLLAVPGILAAGAHETLKLMDAGTAVEWPKILVGAALAAVSGYLCIAVLLRFIQRVGLAPFTVYRLILAAVLVAMFAPR